MTPATRAVLSTLSGMKNRDMFGLEVCRQSGRRSGTVYPILRQMVKDGWLTAEWEDENKWRTAIYTTPRPRRRYYRLTALGRRMARSK